MRIFTVCFFSSFFLNLFAAPGQVNELAFQLAQAGQDKPLKQLDGLGVDWKQVDPFGQTLLHLAAQSGSVECVNFLLGKGLGLEKEDRLGRTPCLIAAEFGHSTLVNLLLKKGANAKTRDSLGYSCLWWSIANKDIPALKLLVHHGANVNLADSKGRKPMDLVRFNLDDMSVTRLLIDLGAEKGSHARKAGDLGATLRGLRNRQWTELEKEVKAYRSTSQSLPKAGLEAFFQAKIDLLKGQLEDASRSIEKALSAEKQNCPPCQLIKAEILGRQRLYEEAQALIQTLPTESNTLLGHVYLQIGIAAFGFQDYDQAQDFLKLASKLSTQPIAELDFYMGCLADEKGNLDQARDNLKRFLELRPQSPLAVEAHQRMEQLGPSVLGATSFDGRRLDLADYQGQWVLIDFWTAGTHYKNTVFTALEKIHESLSGETFTLLSMNIDRDENEARDMVAWLNPEWPQYLDPSLKVGKSHFEVASIPAFVLVSPSGEIQQSYGLEDIVKTRKFLRNLKKTIK